MKHLITLVFILFCSLSYAQNAPFEEAKQELKELYSKFTNKQLEHNKEKKKLEDKIAAYDYDIKDETLKTQQLKEVLDSIYIKQLVVKDKYLLKGVPGDSLTAYFPVQKNYTLTEKSLVPKKKDEGEKEVYIMYGDGKIVEENVFKGDKRAEEVFKDIFSIKSETCLGSLEIPGDKQKIQLYTNKFAPVKDSSKYVCFKEVKFSIRGGTIHDIRVYATNQDKSQQYLFENKIPISLLNYTQNADKNYLFLKIVSSLNTDTIPDISKKTGTPANLYTIKLTDVLVYLPNPGNNFVPEDIEFTLPTKDEGAKDALKQSRRVYKVNQDTNLQSIMEMRTYTDFLGLFDDSANGIVQIEGNADFFIAPYQSIRAFPSNFFRKISPYVHYSRLDEDNRGLTLANGDTIGHFRIPRRLEIIEKSYLDMGLILDIFSFSPRKDYPFNINLFGSLRYQIATIEQEDEENVNFKTYGLGGGLRFEFRRFNNFGFTLTPEFTFYNHLNRYEFLNNPDNFWVLRNEAEIYYYPGETKSQSIFLRLRTFWDTDDGEDSFFQLQFGYRFSIGLGSVKQKPSSTD